MRHRRTGTNRTRLDVPTTVHVRNDVLRRPCAGNTERLDSSSRTRGDKCGTAANDADRVLQNDRLLLSPTPLQRSTRC